MPEVRFQRKFSPRSHQHFQFHYRRRLELLAVLHDQRTCCPAWRPDDLDERAISWFTAADRFSHSVGSLTGPPYFIWTDQSRYLLKVGFSSGLPQCSRSRRMAGFRPIMTNAAPHTSVTEGLIPLKKSLFEVASPRGGGARRRGEPSPLMRVAAPLASGGVWPAF